MKKQPIISIIVVAYKSWDLLERCVRSAAQSCQRANHSFEMILVVNDRKFPFYQEAMKDFPLKVIINQKNIGFARGVNQAVREAKGEFLLILNPDVFLERNALRHLCHELEAKNIAISAPKLVNEGGKLQPSIRQFPTLFNLFLQETYLYRLFPGIFPTPLTNTSLYQKKRKVDAISGACWLIKRKIFLETGKFNEQFFLYFEDVDLCKMIKQRGLGIVFVPKAIGVHKGSASSKGMKVGSQYYQSLVLYWKKHRPEVLLPVVLLIIGFGVFSRFVFWYITSLFNDKICREKKNYYGEILSFWLKKK